MSINIEMKRCTTCRETKATSEFNKHTSRRDGLSSECRPCHHTRCRKWREANPEKIRQPDRERQRKWYAANPEKHRAKVAARRARKLDASVGCPAQIADYISRRYAAELILGEPVHLDHIIPLARGGTHSIENLRFIPVRFNLVKGDKLDEEVTDPTFREHIGIPPTYTRVAFVVIRHGGKHFILPAVER